MLNNAIDKFRITHNGDFIRGAGHTCLVLNHKERNKIIIKAVCDIRKIADSFDSIACCGISGLMVVPQIAEILDKNILIVRKTDDECYSDFKLEGAKPNRYIILDDLICSGNTIRYIQRTIRAFYPKSHGIGLYCYIPNECAYGLSNLNLFKRDFGMTLLNPGEHAQQIT